ncbi:MAG: hypothetical protein F6K58_01435 [Symploca sp. SIO2E9]|nr:hypothetical protein [Symploca sp. SIO2E9]
MKKLAPLLGFSLLLSEAFSSAVVAQTTETSIGTAADLRVSPRLGIGYSTSGAGYDGFTSFQGFVPLQQTPGSTLTFLQGQLLLDNGSHLGGNILLGHRFYSNQDNRIFGGYLSYDNRNTGNSVFNQLGAGLESLGKTWDLRANAYVPIGNTRQRIDQSTVEIAREITGEPFFQNHFLVAEGERQLEQITSFEAAMAGFELEAGIKLARLGKQGDLRGYGGLYYYDAAGTDGALGWRLRLEANPADTLNLGLSFQEDAIFGTNVVFNVGANFPGTRPRGVNKQETVLARIGESVARTASITVDSQQESESFSEAFTIEATNPETGEPWFFQQVNLGVAGGDGTFENPFGILQDALNATLSDGNDIVYVQAGANPGIPGFTIGDQVQVLSTGPLQEINTTEFGLLQLPLSGAGILPGVADTVTLGNNNVLSGFEITAVSGPGIEARNISNGVIRDNAIASSMAAGVLLDNTAGTVTLTNNSISNSNLEGILAQAAGNTKQEINLDGNLISSSGSQGIFIQASETAQQNLSVKNNAISDSGSQGIFVQASGETLQEINIDNSTVNSTRVGSNGSGGQGIFVQASENSQQELNLDNTTVNDSLSQGVFIQANEDSQQELNLNNTTVSNSLGQGVFVQASGNTQQNLAINESEVNSTKLSSDNSGGQGIFLQATQDSRQNLIITKNEVRNNDTQGIFAQSTDDAQQNLNFNGNAISNSNVQGLFMQASGNSLQEINIQDSKISSTRSSNNSGGQGIFVQAAENAQQELNIDTTTVNDSDSQGVFIQVSNNSQQQIAISDTTVSDNIGQGIFIQASGDSLQGINLNNITVNNTRFGINSSGGQGIFIQANEGVRQEFTITNTEVSNSASQGVFIQANNTAQAFGNVEFNLLQDNDVPGLAAFMNSSQTLCLALNGNNSNTDFLLQQNAGTFNVVDNNNTGTVIRQGNFNDVAVCR